VAKDGFSAELVAGRGAFTVQAQSAQRFARHTHDEFGIGILLAGAQRSWSGRGMVEAGAGDLITVNPGEVHDGEPIGESRTWAMLYLAPERVMAMVRDIREGKPAEMAFTSPVMRSAQTARRFATAYAALRRGEIAAQEERLLLLFAGLLEDAPAGPGCSSALHCARARIDADPAGHHPLEELAQDAGISQFRLIRSFAQLTGLTPRAYVVQRRLDVARLMIRRGAALADASVAAGFADQSHFHRAFTRRYGLTPGAFAAAMR